MEEPPLQTVRALVHFEEDHPLFVSHFPGSPCVPASMMVRVFIGLVERETGLPRSVTLEHFRFRRFVRPGLCLCVAKFFRGRADLELWAGNRLACEGRVVWNP